MMFKKEFYDMRFRAIFIIILVIGLFFLVAPFQKLAVSVLREYTHVQSMPEILKKLLPAELVERLNDWTFFIYSQWFGKNFGQIVPVIAVIMAFPLFAREYENGTIEFLLARNNRKKAFSSKTLVALLVLIVEITFFSLLPALYSLIANKPLAYEYTASFTLHAVCGSIFWFSVALFLSVISSDQVKPLLGSFAVLAGTTVLGLLKPLRFMNVYSYILGIKIFESGKADLKYSIVLLIISCITIFASYQTFSKREI